MATIAFSKIAKVSDSSLVDTVYREIKINILSHALKGGEKLTIKQISREMGVSLTPVREAINKLSHDGLLEIVPGSGAYVTALTPQDVNELFECRIILELAAIEYAVPRLPDAVLQDLRNNLGRMHAEGQRLLDTQRDLHGAGSQAFQSEYFELDSQFHTTMVAQAGNRQLLKLYKTVNLSMHVLRAVYWDYYRHVHQRMESTLTEHQRVLDAVESRDIEAAKTALRLHLEQGKLVALSHILRD